MTPPDPGTPRRDAHPRARAVERRRLALVAAATLAVHLVAGVVFASIRIYEATRPAEAQFEAPPPAPEAIRPEQLEYKVRMQERQSESARPSLRRMTVTPVPNQPLPDLASALPSPVAGPSLRGQGTGSGSGLGGSGVGFGAVAVNPRAFGTTRALEHSFVGRITFFTWIDRLRTADGRWFEGQGREEGRRQLYTYRLDIPEQPFTEGFPGISQRFEWFAIDFVAEVNWPAYAAGDVAFRLSSDDGSILQVNGQDVIDHDGAHGFSSKEGTVAIPAGRTRLRVAYFQGPRPDLGLVLEWKRPGTGDWKVFDLREFLPYQ